MNPLEFSFESEIFLWSGDPARRFRIDQSSGDNSQYNMEYLAFARQKVTGQSFTW